MEVEPASLSIPDRYKLLIGGIVPRPIAFVSTISPGGLPNLAPFSFFSGIGSNPMTLLFCPANHPDGREKDSLRNAEFTERGGVGEFVVNVATEEYARQVAAASEVLPYGESEFDLVGLTQTPSVRVRPPRVLESPVAFECRTREILRLNPGGDRGGNIVVGEVVHLYVRDDLINDRYHIDPEKLRAIGRMGGPVYTRTRDRFEMPMSRDALNLPAP